MNSLLNTQRRRLRTVGIKTMLKESSWRLIAAILLFYIVRDSLLYILIPLFIRLLIRQV